VLWVIGAVTAILTAYYMGREYFLVFVSAARWHTAEEAGAHGVHPHDPRKVMTFPLVVLALCSVLGGFVNLPFHPNLVFLERWLAPVVGRTELAHHYGSSTLWIFAIVESALAIAGVLLARAFWRNSVDRPALEPRFLFMAWFIDASYDRFVARPSESLSRYASAVLDNKVIDGAVNGVGTLVRDAGVRLRRVQSGYVRSYALGILAGAVALVAFILVRAGV
jgi:NADH-quinone oxidoreductase subunit L